MTYFLPNRNIYYYSSILTEMEKDWGLEHYPYILTYCGITPQKSEESKLFWKSWISYIDDVQIGICGIYEDIKKRMWMGYFGVLPSFRKKGYGKILLNHMEQETKKLGHKNLYCYCDERPLTFYKLNGYQLLFKNEFNIIKKSLV